MSANWRITASCLLVAAIVIAIAAQTKAQRGGERPAPRPEALGVIKSVDATAGTITVSVITGRDTPVADKTFTLAKDAEVVQGDGGARRGYFKEAKLAELTAGVSVSLTLSADQKTVEAIAAQGPMVRGVLKTVDAGKNTLTISVSPNRREETNEEKSYTVPGDAEIAVDDGRGRRFSIKEGKLADLAGGAIVTLWLSLDQKQVRGIQAEGPNLYGVVKSLDAGKHLLTLAIGGGRGTEAEERPLTLASDTVVLLDDGKGRRLSIKEGKLSDVPVGSVVYIKMSADQKTVGMVRAEGPALSGQLKAVDATKGTVIILTGGRENPEEKTYSVAKDARIAIDDKEGKLTDLKAGDEGAFVLLRLSLDQKTVQVIQARQAPRERR